MIKWVTNWDTKFSLMEGKNYDMDLIADSVRIEETVQLNAHQNAIIPIRTHTTFKNFKFSNDLKLDDDMFSIFFPIHLNEKQLAIEDCEFNIYGSVMITFSTLSFISKNVHITSNRLVGAFTFVTTCDPAVDYVHGEILIDNLRLEGARSTLFKYGGIYIAAIQNVTVKDSYIASYGFMQDAKHMFVIESPHSCKPADTS